jgi:hypothetical protein
LNFYYTPRISSEINITESIWFGVYVSIAAVIAAAITSWVDKMIENAVNEESELINSFYFAFVSDLKLDLIPSRLI